MLKKLTIFIASLCCLTYTYAQDIDLDVRNIPDSLMKKADAVVRYSIEDVQIVSPGTVKYSHKYAITILNESGRNYATLYEYYSKMKEIKSIQGALYNAQGKQVKKLKKSDISDLSGVDDASLMSDARFKKYTFYQSYYPYTVMFDVDVTYNTALFLPTWQPVLGNYVSVQHATFNVSVPGDGNLRYKQVGITGVPAKVQHKNNWTYSWELENFKAKPSEVMEAFKVDKYPLVLIASSKFQYGKFDGQVDSWDSFGKFIYTLNKERDELPGKVKQVVHKLTDNVQDPKEKARILYRYLQNNTRYISVQLGVGGLQTYDAAYVAENNYGDCKALTNFMKALLKEAGIKAYCSVIDAGNNSGFILEDFPSSQFNHVILCVPFSARDTTWLECTSQDIEFGYLGGFTSDRATLLYGDFGGKLVHTPAYQNHQNLQLRIVNAEIDPQSGNVKLSAKTMYTGLQHDDPYMAHRVFNKEDMTKYLRQRIDLPSFDLVNYNYAIPPPEEVPALEEDLELLARNYVTKSGKRLFVEPNMLTKQKTKFLEEKEERRFDFQFSYAYVDVDTVNIKIPAGYKLETIPKQVSLNNPVGKYSYHVQLEGDILHLYRRVEFKEGVYPAADYQAFVKYMNAIRDTDGSKVVFVKAE